MSLRAPFACMAFALACAGSQRTEVPLCSAAGLRPSPAEACHADTEFAAYRGELALALARQLQWQIPEPLSISVELDDNRRVERVCAAPEAAALPWNLRYRLVNSLGPLRAMVPGPACAAATRVELSGALLEVASGMPERHTLELASCLGIREHICIQQNAPVCAVFPDDTRRTYGNACSACENSSVKGWFEGPCPLR